MNADFRFPISDFRFPISDFRFPISDFRFPISDFRFLGIAFLCCFPLSCSSPKATNFTPRAAPGASPPTALDSRTSFFQDAGTVVAGETVSHSFEITNFTDEVIRIARDEDIQKNCGCSTLEPSRGVLEPGEKCEVKLVVRTGGMADIVEKGGQITWSSPSGAKLPFSFRLRATAVPAFAATPESLTFGPEEMKRGEAKSLRFTTTFPIDWGTFKAWSSSPYFQLRETKIQDGVATCKVVCSAPVDVDAVEDRILAQATLRESGSGKAEIIGTAHARVFFKQRIDLAFTPKSLVVYLDGAKKRGATKLLLRGERLAENGRIVEAIKSEGYRVDWSLGRSADPKKAILEVELTPDGVKPSRHRTFLEISVVGSGVVRVPLLIMENKTPDFS